MLFNKRIKNIVFFEDNDGTASTGAKKAVIFYRDGTITDVDYEEGIDVCERIAAENKITTKDDFTAMINKKIIHVMTKEQLKEKFQSLIPTVAEQEEERALQNAAAEQVRRSQKNSTNSESSQGEKQNLDNRAAGKVPTPPVTPRNEKNGAPAQPADRTTPEKKDEVKQQGPVAGSTSEKQPEAKNNQQTGEKNKKDTDKKPAPATDEKKDGQNSQKKEANKGGPTTSQETATKAEEPKKKNIFQRAWEKIKKNKLVKRILICVTALAVACGLYSCNKKSIDGTIARMNIPGISQTSDKNIDDDTIILEASKQIVNEETEKLLATTNNKDQKNAMTKLNQALIHFNYTFANNYTEKGKDIKPALKFDEMVALQMAYNNFSSDQIRAYFNGEDIKAEDLSRAYKDGSLQLMGAYVIENSEHPVDMGQIIESEEGRQFYEKYHTLFLAAKEAEGEDKLAKVSEFFRMVREDFPVSSEKRTFGISHSSNRNIEPYKLSVTPMIAAAEMLWQNLEIDNTLNDEEIKYFNDLGLCNIADKTFERIQTITLTSKKDSSYPTYLEFKRAMVFDLIGNEAYYIDDEHRELTKLDSFINAVNWHSRTITTTTTHTVVTETELPMPDDEKARIDTEIERENQAAREAAERRAEEERRRQQEAADREAERIRQQIAQDEQDMQQDIDAANERLGQGQTVSESDFGDHGVDFDDQYTDGQGNLTGVEHITTDPSGDMTDQPLPDPNQTGAAFDRGATNNATTANGWIVTTPSNDNNGTYWTEYATANAAAVESYVDSMASDTYGANLVEEDVDAYQYTK